MSIHVFGAVVTGLGTAANNRGLTEGNITTLQKLVWDGQVHTTVSAESIRFALRRRLAESGQPCNRNYDEDSRENSWADPAFSGWGEKAKGKKYIDDDLLGFMIAEAAKEENGKGTTQVRRAVLEVTRAVSLTPWPGDVTFNAASPGATPSAQKKGSNPVPYGTEMHATRYQYGFALTPEKLSDQSRAGAALEALCRLGEVAGNHGRFLFDFSPESLILRVSHDPAPRILYAYRHKDATSLHIPEIVRKVKSKDIPAKELVIGGAIIDSLGAEEKAALDGASLKAGVIEAYEEVVKRLKGSKA
jgi:CRISPR-associated protein Cst2